MARRAKPDTEPASQSVRRSLLALCKNQSPNPAHSRESGNLVPHSRDLPNQIPACAGMSGVKCVRKSKAFSHPTPLFPNRKLFPNSTGLECAYYPVHAFMLANRSLCRGPGLFLALGVLAIAAA